jgi:hypothetical protein
MAYYSLKNGVGRGQRNDSMDVHVVQVLLTKHQYTVKTDGVYTEELQTKIEAFQTEIEKMLIATGTVTAGSNTLRRLELALGEPYELASNNLVLGVDILDVVKPMGVRFYCNAKPNKTMVITSGRRTTASQADAMYTKLTLGDDILKLYKNKKAAKEVVDAYNAAVQEKLGVAQTKAAIKSTLDTQVAGGVYISSHLNAKAFDIRSRDLSGAQKTVFSTIGNEYCRKVILEGKPPHFHLEIH